MNRAKTFSGKRASQMDYELNSFIELLKENNVKRYLEIGARDGDSFYAVMSALPKGSYGLAVDLPGGLWGKERSRSFLARAVEKLNTMGYVCEYLYADSQAQETVSQIQSMEKFDCVFIDGDHTLFGVTKDWNNYKDMGKIIAFHDIVGTGQKEKVHGNPVEVPILWEKIKKDHKHFEFVEKDSAMGIGCLLR